MQNVLCELSPKSRTAASVPEKGRRIEYARNRFRCIRESQAHCNAVSFTDPGYLREEITKREAEGKAREKES